MLHQLAEFLVNGRIRFRQPPALHNFIGGHWVQAQGGKTFRVPDPLTGELSFIAPQSGVVDCQNAINAANLFHLGSDDHWPVLDRAQVFQKAGQLLDGPYRKLAAGIIRMCMPKSEAEAMGEIDIITTFLSSLSVHRLHSLYSPRYGGPGEGNSPSSQTMFAPWGAVSMIHPFNYPMEIEWLQACAALACGNSVITKPHETCGPASVFMAQVLLEAGLPPALLQVIHGFGQEVSLLALSPLVRKVLLTGSSRTAQALASPKLVCEQSGVNWIYLTEYDYPVEKVAASIAHSALSMNGQRCSSARLLFAHSSWLKKGLIEAIRQWVSKNLAFDDYSLPVLMSWNNERVGQAIDKMQGLGLRLLYGGESIPDFRYQSPTDAPFGRFSYGAVSPSLFTASQSVFRQPKVQSLLREERFFGNLVIVPMETAEDHDAVVEFVRSLPERLTCGIGADNLRTVRDLLRQLPANGVTNWGRAPWTTGAQGTKPFGPVAVNGACIGGSDDDIRNMWMIHYGLHEAT